MSPDTNNIAIINLKVVDYFYIIYGNSKSDENFCNKILYLTIVKSKKSKNIIWTI